MILQNEIEDNEGAVATIYGLSKDENSLIVKLTDEDLLFVPISMLKLKNTHRYILEYSFAEIRDLPPNSRVFPVIEETPIISKKSVETAKINIKKTVTEFPHALEQVLAKEEYEIERVPVHKVHHEPAQMRVEDDYTIIPVQEEIIVTQTRYLVREEIRIRKVRTERKETIQTSLKKEAVTVERKKFN